VGRAYSCGNNLKQIVLALHDYHDDYGSFPPAYIADASGKPMHSWRVLILPYLEEQACYARYNFNEPWNGPNNILLATEMPRSYGCPSDASRKLGITNYLAIVGPQTLWPGSKPIQLSDVQDGTGNTLAVVESHGTGVCWLAPIDLDAATIAMQINPPAGGGLSSPHRMQKTPFCNVALADGSIRRLTSALTPVQIKALLTIDGGERVDLP
jgi:hypothetical protein